MPFDYDPIVVQDPKIQQLSFIIKHFHESPTDYQTLKGMINSAPISLGQKMMLIQQLDDKFSN